MMSIYNTYCITGRKTLILTSNLPRPIHFYYRIYSQDSTELPASFADEDASEELIKKPHYFFNKSRLLPEHRKMLVEELPYSQPKSWAHLTEKYQRKMFGKYGFGSNVDPRICFPTKQDLKLKEEYERVAFPHTMQEMMQKIKLEKETKQLQIIKREEDIAKKLEKLEQWKAELNAKNAKREAEAIAAQERKERIVEEVRRHFGFKIDPKDERFKELLEKKEKEDRKKQKDAKRKAKEDKMMAKLAEKTKETAASIET